MFNGQLLLLIFSILILGGCNSVRATTDTAKESVATSKDDNQIISETPTGDIPVDESVYKIPEEHDCLSKKFEVLRTADKRADIVAWADELPGNAQVQSIVVTGDSLYDNYFLVRHVCTSGLFIWTVYLFHGEYDTEHNNLEATSLNWDLVYFGYVDGGISKKDVRQLQYAFVDPEKDQIVYADNNGLVLYRARLHIYDKD